MFLGSFTMQMQAVLSTFQRLLHFQDDVTTYWPVPILVYSYEPVIINTVRATRQSLYLKDEDRISETSATQCISNRVSSRRNRIQCIKLNFWEDAKSATFVRTQTEHFSLNALSGSMDKYYEFQGFKIIEEKFTNQAFAIIYPTH